MLLRHVALRCDVPPVRDQTRCISNTSTHPDRLLLKVSMCGDYFNVCKHATLLALKCAGCLI